MEDKLKIILIEDNKYDAELISNEIKKISRNTELKIIYDFTELQASFFDFSPDLVLSDYTIPKFTGIDVIKLVKKMSKNTPIIIITGSINEETAAYCIKTGADDYILKDHIIHLGPSIKQSIKNKRINLAKIKAEENLKQSEKNLQKTVRELEKTLEEIIVTIARIVEMKDPYVAGHQQRVSDLSAEIASVLGMPEEQIYYIKLASLIHDVGKINIPASILNKPGKLTEIEFELIKTHSQIGYEIMKKVQFPWPIAKIILQHHERINGAGYPSGLKNSEILAESKICAVADVVEAMASYRPYRPAIGIDKALDEISSNAGILYDKNVVDACIYLFKEKKYKLKEIQDNASVH